MDENRDVVIMLFVKQIRLCVLMVVHGYTVSLHVILLLTCIFQSALRLANSEAFEAESDESSDSEDSDKEHQVLPLYKL